MKPLTKILIITAGLLALPFTLKIKGEEAPKYDAVNMVYDTQNTYEVNK